MACLFSGLTVAPGIINYLDALPGGAAAEQPSSLFDREVYRHEAGYHALLSRPQGGPSVYSVHAELGRVMTKAATVIRHNAELQAAYEKVCELDERARQCSLADTGGWANQEVVFARALEDMFPLAKTILLGALARDECRGSHYKPEFAMPEIDATEPAERRRQAEAWCQRFEENNRKWLKTTVATLSPDGEPQLSYEEVDTSLIRPRPRLYGVVGGDVIEEVWKERETGAEATSSIAGELTAVTECA